MTENNLSEDSMVEVRCYFVRHRNALAVRANFSPIYMDHYLHLLENQIKLEQENDQLEAERNKAEKARKKAEKA